jgi:hypothetical protein
LPEAKPARSIERCSSAITEGFAARTATAPHRPRDTADAAFAIVAWAKPNEAAFVPGAGEAFGLVPR